MAVNKDNNKMLQSMRKSQKIAFWMRMVYFFIATGLVFGAFYFIAPFLKSTLNIYQTFSNGLPDITKYSTYVEEFRTMFPNGNTEN